ncbi:MAG: helix-turn-helix transcriptional regulator [Lewinella sp.]|nr:helix-turn-helix transcriptional regulator [Lewinella sp.]
MKKNAREIRAYNLDAALFRLHKEEGAPSDFGMDNSVELFEGGFGLYSTQNTKSRIGPIKSQYFRVSLVRSGHANFDIGIEKYHPAADSIVFGFPGQVFSLYDKSDDFLAYYMLFSEEFMPDSAFSTRENKETYPFLTYTGIQCFPLDPVEADEIERLIFRINEEIRRRKKDSGKIIQLHIQLILAYADRSYERQALHKEASGESSHGLLRRFIKLVEKHFLTQRKVSDYARMLNVNPDYLNRIIKAHSKKTAGELIDEMILTEAKAYLLQTELSNAEIAYLLEFADPSHFNRFFKKQTNCTPLQYRNRS